MSVRRKVLVAGAGVFGLAIALALADAGLEVAVHDPAEPGDSASGVAAGMLAPVLEAALDATAGPHLDLLLAARDLWPALAARAGIALDRSGALVVGDPAWLTGIAARLSAYEPIGREVLEAAATALAPRLREGLLVRDDWRLDAPSALAALRRAAEAAGAVFRRAAVETMTGHDLLVVATGASQSLARLAPEVAHLAPIKGHILRAPGVLHQVVRGEGIYAVPAAGGLMIGATMEPGRDDRELDPVQVQRLREAAVRLFPDLAEAPMEAATGVRAATPDGLPMAGLSDAPDVLVAAGARRNGWLLAPLIAEVVLACVTGREPGPWAARLAPSRFSPPG
jgi:glycine oxidase